jgi:hypothetical protein
MRLAILAGALALAACQPAAEAPAKPAEPAAPAAPVAAVESAKPSGPAKAVEAEDDHFPEAYVTDVHHIKDADFKIFSTAGGDPAVNGLYTYLARYNEDERGWTQVYMLGDFNSWEVVEESATRVVLKVSRSWAEQESGDIKTADEKLIIDLPATGETPVMVTPAT